MKLRTSVTWFLRGNGDQARIRSIWRVLVPIMVTFGVGGLGLHSVVFTLISVDDHASGFIGNWLFVLGVLGALLVSARYLDRRPVRAYGFSLSRAWWTDFAAGAVVGVVPIATAFTLAYSLDWVTVVDVWSAGDAGTFVGWFVLYGIGFLCVAFWEETLFRGIFISNAAEGLRSQALSPRRALLGAWAVSTVVFGLVHLPLGTVPGDATLVGMLVMWLALGGLLGLGYVLSGQLAFPIGLHFTVNYATNNVFFGGDMLPTVVQADITAPTLWHPIGGLTLLPGILVACVLTGAWFYRRTSGLTLATHIPEPPSTASSHND